MIGGVPAPSRRDVMIRLLNGAYYFRRITNAVINSDGTETLTIDSAIGTLVPVANIDRISFLIPSRLDADAIEIGWASGNVASSVFKVTDLADITI
jgi:hypothetical protein